MEITIPTILNVSTIILTIPFVNKDPTASTSLEKRDTMEPLSFVARYPMGILVSLIIISSFIFLMIF